MRRILARFEQLSLPNTLTQQFPLFAAAGRNAAQLWLHGVPMSAGAYRDERYQRLIASTADFAGDEKRHAAFNDAFAREIALSIARQSHAEVRHG
ncbi:hypothetical protein [Paraburkholderia sp. RL17-381-BIF-C]|uniref:hypothetical protein n=1 Tax=Paraburkholderia sp. RL17-381-BIF-C TaxID=3031635 RepID=UPI0038BC4D5E